MQSNGLRVFGQPIRIEFDDPAVGESITVCYSAFLDNSVGTDPGALTFNVRRDSNRSAWDIYYVDQHVHCPNRADLVYFLEKALTIELQKIRRDLLFVHAAAISFDGRCTLVAGESGAGKSTLCWGLCNEGGAYLSDELAPVDLTSMRVEPYPHAICLKHIAEGGYAAPTLALDTGRTMHIPVEAIPGVIETSACTLQNVVFLVNDNELTETNPIEIGAPEAALRLYVNSLNQLAHENDGLAAVSRIARHARCFKLGRSAPAKMRRELMRLVGGG